MWRNATPKISSLARSGMRWLRAKKRSLGRSVMKYACVIVLCVALCYGGEKMWLEIGDDMAFGCVLSFPMYV